jgi:predicted glycosyltransferase
MHDVLAFAKMVISDSQTMTMEAAVLGVPSIRYNSFVEKISYLKEMESRFDLTYGFLPGRDENKMLNKIDELLQVKNLNNLWLVKREQMLNEKDDFNQWIINYFEAQNEQ